MTDPIHAGFDVRLPSLPPPAELPLALRDAAPELARARVDALDGAQVQALGEQVRALPLAERETLANDLVGKLDAPQLRKLEPAFGRENIAEAVERRGGPALRDAYAALPREDAAPPDRADPGKTRDISTEVVNPSGGEINDATWTIDDQGRPIHAEATLRTVFSDIDRSDAETQAQRTAADRGVDGDQGGHLLGHRFVTDQGLKNLFPQNGNFNMGAYKTLENEWAAWVDKGMDVRVTIDLTPREADRPDRVRISYEVLDPADGRRVYDQRVSFDNRAGQRYDRVDADQMDGLIAAG
ncbi:DNA/RNA non-specific endonuclease [Lysobacter sp. K5869]|uniref:DNA/RNA non-specific endonuclease n=1 Tax=Lysobacter sp. K5869 TaxID=2820808 RepID=UPI001C0615F8|nr:DNA/RNA non-specific endonuclease [Lysobacter sp. K5869]QWP78019.1 DNA/RNA non-specific endonuclease [Lysobacter sp. K5869]